LVCTCHQRSDTSKIQFPRLLGIEILGEVISILIQRNNSIPFQIPDIFHTTEDNKTGVHLVIYEDERLIGEFYLEGLIEREL
jgi:molecular chaperone DnaK (HSP70)